MMNQQVEQWIREAAQAMGADAYAPAQWSGDHDGAWALVVRTDRRTVISVHGDELADSAQNGTMWNDVVVAYAYGTEHDVMGPQDVTRAVRQDDGTSIDPTGYGEGSLDFLAGNIAESIVEAATYAAGQARTARQLRDDVAAQLPAGFTASVIPQLGERHVAVLVWDTSDVATVVRTDEGRLSVEGADDENSNEEVADVAAAVRYILANNPERGESSIAGAVLTLVAIGALFVWLAPAYIAALFGL